MPDLDIPDDALQAFLAIDDDYDSDEDAADAIRPIVNPVLADELRRLAGHMHHPGDRDLLLSRADGLDQGAAHGQTFGETDGDR